MWRIHPYRLVDGSGLLGGGQVEYGQKRLPATLEFADRLGAIAHFGKGSHQAPRGALMGWLKIDQAPCGSRAYIRFCVLLD